MNETTFTEEDRDYVETGFRCWTCDTPTYGQHYCSEMCREADHRECPDSETGAHQPDIHDGTVLPAHWDAGLIVVTMTCAVCGQTGHVFLDAAEIEFAT